MMDLHTNKTLLFSRNKDFIITGRICLKYAHKQQKRCFIPDNKRFVHYKANNK